MKNWKLIIYIFITIFTIHSNAFADKSDDDRILLWLKNDGFHICLPDRGLETDQFMVCPYGAPKKNLDAVINLMREPNSNEFLEIVIEEKGYFDVRFNASDWKALVCNLLKYKDSNNQSCKANAYKSDGFRIFDDRTEESK